MHKQRESTGLEHTRKLGIVPYFHDIIRKLHVWQPAPSERMQLRVDWTARTDVETQLHAAHHLDRPLVHHLADNLDVGRVDLHVLYTVRPCSISIARVIPDTNFEHLYFHFSAV